MRLPFGIEIRRQKQSPKTEKNPLLRRLLSPFQYGKSLLYDTDVTRQLNAYRSWVYCAAGLNAQCVAQTPLRLYFAKPAKNIKTIFPTKAVSEEKIDNLNRFHNIWKIPAVRKSVGIEEVVEHPVLDLFRTVNNFNNSFDLWELTELYQELTGNAYWLILKDKKLKVPREIWTIPPDRITPIPDPDKFISGYKYVYGTTEYTFPESIIIHFKFPNPHNMYLGIAPLNAGIAAYNTNENMQVYNNSMFQNMGRPSGFFETDDVLDEEDFQRLKTELHDVYSGVQNVGKMGLLDHGLTFQQVGLKPDELAFIDGRKAIREEIFNVYGQSVSLWSENTNRANADAAERQFYRRTIRPRCIRLAEKLNEKLLPRYDGNLFFAFDDPSTDDKLIDAQIRKMDIGSGVVTINESRKKMHLPPLKDGDSPLIQIQYAPLESVVSGATLNSNPGATAPLNEDKPNNKPPKDEEKLPKNVKPSKALVEHILMSMLEDKIYNQKLKQLSK